MGEFLANYPRGSILGLALCLLDALSYDIICNIAVSADDTTPYSKYDQSSDRSNNCGATDVKTDGSLMKNHLWRCRDWVPSLNWIRTSTLSQLLKVLWRKVGTLICSIKSLSCEVEIYFSNSIIWRININLCFSVSVSLFY